MEVKKKTIEKDGSITIILLDDDMILRKVEGLKNAKFDGLIEQAEKKLKGKKKSKKK